MTETLFDLTANEIDSLPFGYVALAPDGTIRKYNRYEADLARKDPQEVLGKNFFREVAPCTQVQEFEGRFRELAEGQLGEPTLTFDFEFAFRHGSQKVRIGFVRSPLDREIIMTVNRVRDLDLPIDAQLRHDAALGRLSDTAGHPAVIANPDLWLALEALHADLDPENRRRALHRLGCQWGLKHALRVEGFVQRQHGETLREVELQVALESLSGSIGVLGLGRFDVHLGYRERGLVLIEHHGSPFAEMLSEHDDHRCAVLAGFHAGFLSYLSGRSLEGRELRCSEARGASCQFVIGTSSRLDRLVSPAPDSPDAHLLLALGLQAGNGGSTKGATAQP